MSQPPDQSTGRYSLEIVEEITGVASQTILHYQEHGLVHPAGDGEDFGDDAIHTLRRIEHIRQACEANLAGVKLILGLLERVDRLEIALRERR